MSILFDVIMMISAVFLSIWVIGVVVLKTEEWYRRSELYNTKYTAIKQVSIVTFALGTIVSCLICLVVIAAFLFRPELLA